MPHGDCQVADIAHKELQETKELPLGPSGLAGASGALTSVQKHPGVPGAELRGLGGSAEPHRYSHPSREPRVKVPQPRLCRQRSEKGES